MEKSYYVLWWKVFSKLIYEDVRFDICTVQQYSYHNWAFKTVSIMLRTFQQIDTVGRKIYQTVKWLEIKTLARNILRNVTGGQNNLLISQTDHAHRWHLIIIVKLSIRTERRPKFVVCLNVEREKSNWWEQKPQTLSQIFRIVLVQHCYHQVFSTPCN